MAPRSKAGPDANDREDAADDEPEASDELEPISHGRPDRQIALQLVDVAPVEMDAERASCDQLFVIENAVTQRYCLPLYSLTTNSIDTWYSERNAANNSWMLLSDRSRPLHWSPPHR